MEKPIFDQIVAKSGVLGGKPCIRDTRISVEFVLERLAGGESLDEIAEEYQLKREAVQQAILYASRFLDNEIYISVEA